MFIAILTLLSALSISGVAIFYSVIGLATIFPGAFWPVVIMGSVLEVGKLVTASWLYRNWKHTRWLLRTYLTTAVIVLICITSMGIFGFLSKAHLEQNLAEDTVSQRIEIINSKILSEETYIKRQKDSIVRLESTLDRTTTSNTGALDIEIQSLKDAEDKFKTLLAVETNTVKDLNDRLNTTVKDLNDRLKVLDKNVSDVLTSNKSFFNEEKAAAELKASQKEEREQIAIKIAEAQKSIGILITEAQERIQILKDDYAKDTEKLQARIDSLRKSNVADNSGVNNDIVKAEQNILDAQNRIDGYIVEREPLQSSMLKLEAEVGPVKYIAALAVDFGITDKVDTSEAVRWVILIIICVFDPLAVLLLIAANQSFLRRFPVKAPRPQEIVDLEKPDEEDITLKWNEAMAKQSNENMEKATQQLKDWKAKLEAFNKKVPQPEDKPVEIIQEQDETVPFVDLKGQKKTEEKEIAVDKELQQMRFDRYDIEHEKKLLDTAIEAKKEVLDGFDPDEVKFDLDPEPTEEPERTRPDFTEVIEPEQAVQEMMQDPVKAMEEDVQVVQETARKIHKADMDKLAVEPEIGEFTGGYKPTFVKRSQEKIKKDAYVQNEEQAGETSWKKIKVKATTEEDYHERMEKRIEDLMDRLDAGEIEMSDLTPEDRQVIIDIRMQNESGDNLK